MRSRADEFTRRKIAEEPVLLLHLSYAPPFLCFTFLMLHLSCALLVLCSTFLVLHVCCAPLELVTDIATMDFFFAPLTCAQLICHARPSAYDKHHA